MVQTRLMRLWILGLVTAASVSCGSKRVSIAPPNPPVGAPAPAPVENRKEAAGRDAPLRSRAKPSASGQRLVGDVLTQLGTPYKWGGTTPEGGFDCSGLVYWTFGQQGISVPRLTSWQFVAGKKVSKRDILPGDLLFYAWGSDPKQVSHVGIYVGDGEYVHSPGSGREVLRAPAFDAAHRKRFLAARRITSPNASSHQAESTTTDTFSYRVKAGDYIWALARRFNVSPARLLELNGLKADDILRIGLLLLIPAGKGSKGPRGSIPIP